jgi:hypothetical protein
LYVGTLPTRGEDYQTSQIGMKYLLFLLIVFAVLFNGCGFDCESYLDDDIKPLHIDGVVMDKQKAETGCFGIIIWEHQSKIDTLKDVCYCVTGEKGLWKYITKGDSLYKSEQSLVVEVYRSGTIKQFQYPCCSE